MAKKYKIRAIEISFNLKAMRKRFNTLGIDEVRDRAMEFIDYCVEALSVKVQDKKERKKIIKIDDRNLI